MHSRECFWANPKLPRRWGTRPGKLATLLGRETCNRAAVLCLAQGPTMRNLHPTTWSTVAFGEVEETSGTQEDTGKHTWHTDVDRLPGMLPRRGDLPTQS